MITRLVSRRTGYLTLGLAVALALALGLWFGIFQRQEAAASPGIDLVITKTASPPEGTLVVQGGTITYTLIATNSGNAPATNVVIRDTPGANLTFLSITGGAGVTCSDTTGPDYECTAANIAASGGQATVTVVVRVAAAAGATVLNGAYVDPLNAIVEDNEDADDPRTGHECVPVGEGSDVDPATEPDNFECTVHTVGTADLTIQKNANPAEGATVGTGGTITYTIIVGNAASATGTATDVAVRDTFETPLKVSGPIVTTSAGVSCGDTTLADINCTVASLAPNTSASITITVTVTAGAGATVLNGARVDRDLVIAETNEDAGDILNCDTVDEGSDPGGISSEPDNFDCTSHTVTAGLPDLTITKTASPSESSGVDTGDTITYTLTARNEGAATASNVTIRDWLGSGLTFVSLTGGTGVTCPADTVSPFDCTATSIPAGESRTATLVATVSASSGTVMNGARVDPDLAITESNEDADDPALTCGASLGEGTDSGSDTERDNYDCTEHDVGEAAGLNLTLTKTATPTETTAVATGGTITYTITVSATGGTASNVVIRDELGAGLTFVSITGGTGVTCADTTAPYDCTAATVAAGTPRTVTVVATVSATSGTVLNGAIVDPSDAIDETNEDAGDPTLDCTAVGEGTDTGGATSEPDNFDCTSHTVGAAGTRTLNLSPAGWHNFVWTGASGTEPEEAFDCISGKFQIAYEWVDSAQQFQRYVPGHPELSEGFSPLTQYDHMFVLITADNVTCTMPVAS